MKLAFGYEERAAHYSSKAQTSRSSSWSANNYDRRQHGKSMKTLTYCYSVWEFRGCRKAMRQRRWKEAPGPCRIARDISVSLPWCTTSMNVALHYGMTVKTKG